MSDISQLLTATNVLSAAARSVAIPLLSNIRHIPAAHSHQCFVCSSKIRSDSPPLEFSQTYPSVPRCLCASVSKYNPSPVGNAPLVQLHPHVIPPPPNTMPSLSHSTSIANYITPMPTLSPMNFPDTAKWTLLPQAYPTLPLLIHSLYYPSRH